MDAPAVIRRPLLKRLIRSLTVERRTPSSAREVGALESLCHALLSERGEVSGGRLAADLLKTYQTLDAPSRHAFFRALSTNFVPNPDRVTRAAAAYGAKPSQESLLVLQAAVESPRQELFRRCNLAPGGTRVLLEMRRDLLRALREDAELAGVDADLLHLFRSWFNRGFLVLQRIDWRTSALVLERLIEYEAVHQIQGWRDLRRRLEADRRCYAFFHPALADEPLIFIEVALTGGMNAKVQPLLDAAAPVADPTRASAAIFYSITNCQEGLRGVSFGHFLIKHVVEDLGREFPRLRTFATLSPIPGFMEWLTADGKAHSPALSDLLRGLGQGRRFDEQSISAQVKLEITRLCGRYLLTAKHGEAPLDPVARFHLANGARLQRLNWMGDSSESAIRRSLGLMVNYLYRLEDVESNHEAYAKHHKIITSREFERSAQVLRDRGSRFTFQP